MQIGIIGLGKMGLNIALNLNRNNFDVIGYDIQESARKEALSKNIEAKDSVESLVKSLEKPRIVWVMLPAGEITKSMVKTLSEVLEEGDYVIDGGNSFYEDSLGNHEILKEKNINFFDSGTSGGISGALNGGNFMIGGDSEKFKYIEPIFKSLAQKDGYLYTGPVGSGHYLKMVHNGIEYGMMQAIGEGFDLLQKCPYDYDNEKVARLWNNGSVIRSWLMELAEEAFREDPNLDDIKGIVYASGEGQWTVEESLKRNVSLPVITLSLLMRYRSMEEDTFTGKVVASLRKGFGGHKVAK